MDSPRTSMSALSPLASLKRRSISAMGTVAVAVRERIVVGSDVATPRATTCASSSAIPSRVSAGMSISRCSSSPVASCVRKGNPSTATVGSPPVVATTSAAIRSSVVARA